MDINLKKILIADDSKTFLMYIGILLKRMGFSMVPIESGKKVLKLIKKIYPDIVMLDVNMGDMNGTSVLKYLKEDKSTSRIPIIMMSSNSDAGLIEKCRKMGCSYYLPKPIKVDQLHVALEECSFSPLGPRRKHLRVSVNKKVLVKYKGKNYDLYTETLSEGGVYIRKRDFFPIWSELEIHMPLDKGHVLNVKGTVVHTKEITSDVFKVPQGMGIKFTSMSVEQAKILKNYIGRLIAEDIVDSQEENVIEINDIKNS